jgi:putative transposase
MLEVLHEKTSKWINRLDGTPRRKVWFNFWETRLTFDRSYRARLNYVHQNAVKHRLVSVANKYPWCSAGWFERTAPAGQVRSLYSLKTDHVRVRDNIEVSPDW